MYCEHEFNDKKREIHSCQAIFFMVKLIREKNLNLSEKLHY